MIFELRDIPKDISKIGQNTGIIEIKLNDIFGWEYSYKLFLNGVETNERDMNRFNCLIEIELSEEEMGKFIASAYNQCASLYVLGNCFIPLDKPT